MASGGADKILDQNGWLKVKQPLKLNPKTPGNRQDEALKICPLSLALQKALDGPDLARGDDRVGAGAKLLVIFPGQPGRGSLSAKHMVTSAGRPAHFPVFLRPAGESQKLPGNHDGQEAQGQQPAPNFGREPFRQQTPGQSHQEKRPDEGEDAVTGHKGLIQGTLVAG